MHAGVFRDDLSHLSADLTNETCSTHSLPVTRFVRKYSMQIAIVNCGPLEVVALAFATIMFAQLDLESREWLDFRARSVSRFCSGEVVHQLVDILELVERGPAAITATPLRAWRQPHGEGFREVLRRVCLSVPGGKMQHVLSALGFWLVEIRIRLRER